MYEPPANGECRAWLSHIGFDALFLAGAEAALRKPTAVELRHLDGIEPAYADRLANLLGEHMHLSEDERSEIFMHLIELMQNAQDHASSAMGYYVCAQVYPTKGTLRISFVDVGRGGDVPLAVE